MNFTSAAAISCLSLAQCQAGQTLPCFWLPGLSIGQELDPFEKRVGQIVYLLQVKTAPKITLSQVVGPQSCHICSSIPRENKGQAPLGTHPKGMKSTGLEDLTVIPKIRPILGSGLKCLGNRPLQAG